LFSLRIQATIFCFLAFSTRNVETKRLKQLPTPLASGRIFSALCSPFLEPAEPYCEGHA
jgi:hypothetical protein